MKTLIYFILSISLFAMSEKEAYYLDQCEANSKMECFCLGNMYETGRDVEKIDFKKSFIYYQKGCELSQAQACLGLGNLYLKGKGVKHHQGKAITNFGKGCKLGDDEACELFKKYIIF